MTSIRFLPPAPDQSPLATKGAPSAAPHHRTRRLSGFLPVDRLHWTVWRLVIACVSAGLVLRLWYLFHLSINSDEAAAGMMAVRILHGHVHAFYPGQHYGGIEPYLIAVPVGLFGPGALCVKVVPVLLSALACVLVWRIALRLVASATLAALAGALAWVAPLSTVFNSSIEYGFRGVTLLCGLVCVLISLRLLDGRRTLGEFILLGLFVGLGWWSSPEVVYLLVPAGLIILGAVAGPLQGGARMFWLKRAVVAAGAMLLGALPWFWSNVSSGFASLDASRIAPGPGSPSYAERLGYFFAHVAPMSFNLTLPESGSGVFVGATRTVGIAVAWGVVTLVLVLNIRAGGRHLAVVAGIAAFPFLLAVSPDAWYWLDGRYAVYLSPLLVLATATACGEVARNAARLATRRRRTESPVKEAPVERSLPGAADRTRPTAGRVATVMLGIVVSISLGVSLLGFHNDRPFIGVPAGGFLSHWGDPDQPTMQAIADLEAEGVGPAYADYWVAYVLDFLSNGRLTVTPTSGLVRFRDLAATVGTAPRPSWLFVRTDRIPPGLFQFGNHDHRVRNDLGRFLLRLRRLGVAYRVRPAGVLVVVTPVAG